MINTVLRHFGIFLLLLLVQSSVPAYADLQQEMDGMFGTMTNVTAPTAHLGQRRGVITGGSLVARNGITNTIGSSVMADSTAECCFFACLNSGACFALLIGFRKLAFFG